MIQPEDPGPIQGSFVEPGRSTATHESLFVR